MAIPLPLTYPDLVCVDDLDPFAAETTSDFQSLTQDVLHVLVELPGSNPDDPLAGCGVEQFLNGTRDQLQTLVGTIEAQLGRDDRIDTASVTIDPNPDGTFQVLISIGVAGSVIPLEYGWQNGQFSFLSGGA